MERKIPHWHLKAKIVLLLAANYSNENFQKILVPCRYGLCPLVGGHYCAADGTVYETWCCMIMLNCKYPERNLQPELGHLCFNQQEHSYGK